MKLYRNAFDVLKETSRTFYIPINRLPAELKEAVASAYLCMRAIDEIEDHPDLDNLTKMRLLHKISLGLQAGGDSVDLVSLSEQVNSQTQLLPEVTLRLEEWAMLAPEEIAPRIWGATAAMADRMAYWAQKNWQVETEADLDRYTFGVAGAVGLLLSDLWAWYDGTQTNRIHAVGFGRGLQAVNILRNHKEDAERGVSFIPNDWTRADMYDYARANLDMADLYTNSLTDGAVKNFCQIPLTLARGTLTVLSLGKEKLSRNDVMELIAKVS